jgi:hypothetical protein
MSSSVKQELDGKTQNFSIVKRCGKYKLLLPSALWDAKN